ncbi:MAG: ROK family protein [Bacteroidales bacterium]
MSNIVKDYRTILTLDAGGTNFVFQAVRDGKILEPGITLSARQHTLIDLLNTVVEGFESLMLHLKLKANAISFCFPGPSDFKAGIIGDLQNLPLFRGGVALKAMLENHFDIPVFINNDGDLFTYGEAKSGFLPRVNRLLEEAGNEKRYQNLLGITLGTGFGGGVVIGDTLLEGDNSSGGEINRMRNIMYPNTSVEDSLSIRAVRRIYAREARIKISESPTPKEIFEIGMGQHPGNVHAAKRAFDELAVVCGEATANAATIVDGLVVIGGGLANAYPLFLDKMVEQMNRRFETMNGEFLERLEVKVYNLENPIDLEKFLKDDSHKISVPFTDVRISYNPVKKIGVGITEMGTSKAVATGAYDYAIQQLEKIGR